jgi:hypothetical protein
MRIAASLALLISILIIYKVSLNNTDRQKTLGSHASSSALQYVKEFVSATNTPIAISDLSFFLEPGLYVSYSRSPSDQHILIQKDKSLGGFTISCPPPGKGLEAATRLSSEQRLFTNGSSTYSVSFEKWTAPGNNPWIFVWIRRGPETESPEVVCLAQGSTDSDIMKLMREVYETLK